MRGGPAKAAVLSSGHDRPDLGLLDRQRGDHRHLHHPADEAGRLHREKAGAVEVASSVNGQIMPPVMGAAAFLMVEYVGIPYVEVIKHAFLPAMISYIALLYIVHLEAVKGGMEGLPKRRITTWQQSLLTFGIVLASLMHHRRRASTTGSAGSRPPSRAAPRGSCSR